MLLPENMSHSGRDEEDLSRVRATTTEGKKAGAVDFLIGQYTGRPARPQQH